MKNSVVVIKFKNGENYEIPALVIAENRAKYYAEVDGYDLESQEYYDEIDFTLSDQYEIMDWMHNNMDWVDLEDYAVLVEVEKEEIDRDKEWCKGNIQTEIVKRD